MTKRWSMVALAALGAWSLACGGELTVNDEPIGDGDAEEDDEDGEGDEDEEDDEDDEDAPGRQDVIQAIKDLDAKVGDLPGSCADIAGNGNQPLVKWINSQRKDADETEVGCDGSTCTIKMTGPEDAEWMVELTFEMTDGEIDIDSFECQAAG